MTKKIHVGDLLVAGGRPVQMEHLLADVARSLRGLRENPNTWACHQRHESLFNGMTKDLQPIVLGRATSK
jgi:hypothetical protein